MQKSQAVWVLTTTSANSRSKTSTKKSEGESRPKKLKRSTTASSSSECRLVRDLFFRPKVNTMGPRFMNRLQIGRGFQSLITWIFKPSHTKTKETPQAKKSLSKLFHHQDLRVAKILKRGWSLVRRHFWWLWANSKNSSNKTAANLKCHKLSSSDNYQIKIVIREI